MPNAHPTTSTTEKAEIKSTGGCPLASSSHQNLSDNATPKESVDLTEYVQEAHVQDGNSSKDYQSSADKYKQLRKPCIQYQSCFKALVIHDKENEMSTAEILQKHSSFGLDKPKISCCLK